MHDTRTTSRKAVSTPAEYPGKEWKPDAEEAHSGKFNPV